MPKSLFRIKSVNIEGFKAFTKRQSFDLDGRHVFFFGENGLGKTSVVEAIRWCLFGLGSRPGGTIKNQFHSGQCIVELTLQAPDGIWSFQRRLSQSGGIGPSTIRDPSGTIRNLEDVFPQLSRIGPMEGTHVIYAAQQPSSRRPEADITDFSYVVFRYLGIEDVPRLTDLFVELCDQWKEQEDELLSKVDELGATLSSEIAEVEDDLEKITSAPPWGPTMTPNFPQTRDKIDELAKEAATLGADCSGDTLDHLGPGQKLPRILAAVNAVLSGDIAGLQKRLAEVSQLLSEAQSLRTKCQNAAQEIEDTSTELDGVAAKLGCVLDGTAIDELVEKLEAVDSKFGKAKTNLDVVSASLKYAEVAESGGQEGVCPACGFEICLDDFKERLVEAESTWDTDTKELLEQRTRLQERISSASELTDKESSLQTKISEIRSDLGEYLAQASKGLNLPPQSSSEDIDRGIQELESSRKALLSALASQRESENAWQVRIDNLRLELRFHRLRSRSQELRNLYDTRYEALREDVRDWGALRDTVGSLRSEIKTQLDARLQSELPPVAKEMTEVYLRLTGRPTFDTISILQGEKNDGKIALDLRVSSKRGAGTWPVDDGILNGQALNAIQLVPYLVFSRYQEGPLLDLLLLDDPTQAFDTRKIELLLMELADAASHATLLVSTHEEERFLPILKQMFAADEVRVYRAVDLDEDGPHFEDVAITV